MIDEITLDDASRKRGRNELCWCKSGKKYKKCHLNSSNKKTFKMSDIDMQQQYIMSHKICLAPENEHNNCSETISKAHTVSKESNLLKIAENNHVYTFKQSIGNMQKYKQPRIELISINKASTFQGFCSYHDSNLFKKIDNNIFNFTDEECFLHMYRAFCREVYLKQNEYNYFSLNKHIYDQGKPIIEQVRIQNFLNIRIHGLNKAVLDNNKNKKELDNCLYNDDFSQVESVIFEYNQYPIILVSGSVKPLYDFNGDKVFYDDFFKANKRLGFVSVNSFIANETGYIIFSYHKNISAKAHQLIDSLLQKSAADRHIYILQYLFCNFENMFIAPKWWNQLTEKQQTDIHDMFSVNLKYNAPEEDSFISQKILDCASPTIQSIKYINWD